MSNPTSSFHPVFFPFGNELREARGERPLILQQQKNNFMKKLLIAAAFLAAGTLGAKAQSIHLIPKAGIDISKQAVSGLNGEKNKVGFQGGLALEIQPGKSGFAIQPELNYVSKGTKLGNTKVNFNYLELPVLPNTILICSM